MRLEQDPSAQARRSWTCDRDRVRERSCERESCISTAPSTLTYSSLDTYTISGQRLTLYSSGDG